MSLLKLFRNQNPSSQLLCNFDLSGLAEVRAGSFTLQDCLGVRPSFPKFVTFLQALEVQGSPDNVLNVYDQIVGTDKMLVFQRNMFATLLKERPTATWNLVQLSCGHSGRLSEREEAELNKFL
jgi:hypothetical protein